MIKVFSGCILAIAVFVTMVAALLKHFMNKATDEFYYEYGRYPTPEETNMIFQLLISNMFTRNKGE